MKEFQRVSNSQFAIFLFS